MGISLGSIVNAIKPAVIPAIAMVVPGGAQVFTGYQIFKSIADGFTGNGKNGKNATGPDSSLSNPFSRLFTQPGQYAQAQMPFDGMGGNFGSFTQLTDDPRFSGTRQELLENGTGISLPSWLGGRSPLLAGAAAATVGTLGGGMFDGLFQNPWRHTIDKTKDGIETRVRTTFGRNSVYDRIDSAAYDTGLSDKQRDMLDAAERGGASKAELEKMRTQMMMSNLANLMQLLSQILRIMADIGKSIIQNIR